MPSTSIWRATQAYGKQISDYVAQSQAQVAVERIVLASADQDHDDLKGVSIDGGMINIRTEGWKEFKSGVIFDVETSPKYDPDTQEWLEQPVARRQSYTAVLGSVEQFTPALWHLAVEHQVPTAHDTVLVADGAEWIWNVAADYFPDSVEIIDWYHAVEHLAAAAKVCCPDDESAAQRWFKDKRDALFHGHVSCITDDLDHLQLPDHAHYFHVHRHRMRYQEFQECGYPIGSGTVESAIKQFKQRLAGPGMRWKRPSAQHMLTLCAASFSHQFDVLWTAALA